MNYPYIYRNIRYRVTKLSIPGHYAGWVFECIKNDSLYHNGRQYETEHEAKNAAQVYILTKLK